MAGGLTYPDTVERRYRDDNSFRTIVDMMESWIHEAQFSPSEMREACVLAAIHYEFRRAPSYMVRVPAGIAEDLKNQAPDRGPYR